jgi:small subunit ribosomal protein S1
MEVFVALDGKQEGFIVADELKNAEGKISVVVGSRVAARVVHIDRASGAVQLTPMSAQPIVQALAEAPGANAAGAARSGSAVVTGMRVKGKVVGVERYGVFVEFSVAGESRPSRGLVPTTELGSPRGADLRKAFPVGKELEAAVLALDERGRIRLSVVALTAADERHAFETFTAESQGGDKTKGKGEKPTSGFGTFGDLLKKRK